jgi:hypothetical protein
LSREQFWAELLLVLGIAEMPVSVVDTFCRNRVPAGGRPR